MVTISIHILFRGVVKGANFWNSEIKCVFNKRTIKALEICIQILIFKFTPLKDLKSKPSGPKYPKF